MSKNPHSAGAPNVKVRFRKSTKIDGSQLDRNNRKAAEGILGALVDKLNAYVHGGQITPIVRNTLVAPLEALIDLLG